MQRGEAKTTYMEGKVMISGNFVLFFPACFITVILSCINEVVLGNTAVLYVNPLPCPCSLRTTQMQNYFSCSLKTVRNS